MNRPTISVVLPTHNGARFLDRAIESIASQTHQDWELLVVDDASTDDTPRCIATWVAKDERIRGVRLERNRRLPRALNAGFRLARGAHWTWTSDDNWYRRDAFERLLEALTGDPRCDVVYSGYTEVDETGRVLREVPARPPDLLFGNPVGPCFLYHSAVDAALGGYDEDLELAEDYDFWLRASRQFRLCPLDASLYCYRVHDGSLTARRREAVTAIAELALERHLVALERPARADALLRLGAADVAQQRTRRGRRRLEQAMALGRWPLLHPGFRLVLVDLLLGPRAGNFVRRLVRRAPTAQANTPAPTGERRR